MDSLLISAASGMKARLESLEMLANNIANQGSPGFKVDREFYSLYTAPEAREDLDQWTLPTPPTVPVVEQHWTDYAQGPLTQTGNPLHVAISGRGFFSVASPDGGNLYTRNGSFHLSPTGRLETQDGYAVLDQGGQPINLDPASAVDIAPDGRVRQSGGVVAQLGLAEFDPGTLAKRAGTYFEPGAPGVTPRPATEATVHAGRLESSNGSPAESAVRLVSVLRQFEMLQRAILIGSEMGRRADDVAKVGG